MYIRLRNLPVSDAGHELWTTETWYTLNAIPASDPGAIAARPAFTPPADNTLTDKEKAEGWQLLFNGRDLEGWHNYGKTTVGKSWVVSDNAICLDAKADPNGGWQAAEVRGFGVGVGLAARGNRGRGRSHKSFSSFCGSALARETNHKLTAGSVHSGFYSPLPVRGLTVTVILYAPSEESR